MVVPLDVDGFEGTSEGCIEPMEDAAVLQEIVDDPAGYYVNLHTEDFPAGAIRGKLAAGTAPNTAMPVPGADGSIAILGALLAALALAIGLRAWRPLATSRLNASLRRSARRLRLRAGAAFGVWKRSRNGVQSRHPGSWLVLPVAPVGTSCAHRSRAAGCLGFSAARVGSSGPR